MRSQHTGDSPPTHVDCDSNLAKDLLFLSGQAKSDKPGQERPWLAHLPALSPRMTALLVEGDVAGDYNQVGHRDTRRARGDHNHAATAALAAGAARSGWQLPAFRSALLDTNSGGGRHAREIAHRKGADAAISYVQRVWERARKLVSSTAVLSSRADALVDLLRLRASIARANWRGAGRGTALRILMAHWHTAYRVGGRRYTLSYREMAELAGCEVLTARNAVKRLQRWLRLLEKGSGETGSTWLLVDLPADRRQDERTDDDVMDLQVIERLMALDAFAHRGLGASSLKVLAALAHRRALTAVEVAEVAQMSRATAYRHLGKLTEYGLLVKNGDVWLLAPEAVRALENDWEGWNGIAAQENTYGTSWRRRQLHRDQRVGWLTVTLPRLREHRRPAIPLSRGDEPPCAWVADGGTLVDPLTGEVLKGFAVATDGRLIILDDEEPDYDDLVRRSREANLAYQGV